MGRPRPPPASIRHRASAALQPVTAFTILGLHGLQTQQACQAADHRGPGRRAAGRSLPGAHRCCGERSSASQAAPGAESTLPPGVAARPPSASPPPDDSALGRRSSGPRGGGAPGAAAQAARTPANAAHSAAASPLAAPVPQRIQSGRPLSGSRLKAAGSVRRQAMPASTPATPALCNHMAPAAPLALSAVGCAAPRPRRRLSTHPSPSCAAPSCMPRRARRPTLV